MTKSTVAPLAAPSVRDTVSVALQGTAAHSVALKTAAENSTTPPTSSSRINSVPESRPTTSWAPVGPLSPRFTVSVTSTTLS